MYFSSCGQIECKVLTNNISFHLRISSILFLCVCGFVYQAVVGFYLCCTLAQTSSSSPEHRGTEREQHVAACDASSITRLGG